MDDLTAFIKARLDEDEAAAKALGADRWDAQEFRSHDWAIRGAGMGPRAVADTWKPETAFHIARHDPARVLREVEAKRALLAAYEDTPEFSDPWIGLDLAVRICAAVWSDHPDYRAEWAP